jgi:hypothetical protein
MSTLTLHRRFGEVVGGGNRPVVLGARYQRGGVVTVCAPRPLALATHTLCCCPIVGPATFVYAIVFPFGEALGFVNPHAYETTEHAGPRSKVICPRGFRPIGSTAKTCVCPSQSLAYRIRVAAVAAS